MRGFYRVEDMFDFDNVGFTNTVGTTKYLSCADCDVGPIGYHDLTTKMRYQTLSSPVSLLKSYDFSYVAISRVAAK